MRGDAIKDFEARDRAQTRALSRYPLCKYCGERIMGDFVFVFAGDCLCEECLNEEHRFYVDDYIEA
jgi:formylmethanofuran dehydrogenase subunit E